ncbi:putative disease resistance RPP13-like protein 1 [Alnus glutinosa]|uniref:putative disease resistance RPP13-like protein 1 n=1 Tax=Alnus glutinosa TaxID=3517 RepID=UPI002D769C08|nr:putative disease resistance RPP13-like protein 1 [Alnus glutinosa]
MADAVLSGLLGVVFDRLASPELLNFARREGLDQKKLDKWSKTLKRIEAVLGDADEKQHTERAVKDWLDDLRDLAYDVDDILDEFATEDLRQKLTGGNQASPSKVRNLIPACCTGLTPSTVKVNMRLGSEIEKITARFNEMVTQKDDLKLSKNVDRRSYRTKETLAPTSVVTEAHVYGREKDKEAILEFLLGEKRSDVQVSVIPIIGMGGIGKTTLAQLIYNDEKVQNFFDLKAWAYVSEDFDAVTVTKTILQSLTSKSCDRMDLNWLQVKLKEKLKGKKFLVVLDDLWNENHHYWTILRAPFEAGASGSTIIITTRNEGVSSKTGTIPAHSLKGLSNDVCLSILSRHALGTRDFSGHQNFKDIGEEIVRRCKGSPLAAKVLGGVLCNKLDRDAWKEVLNSNIWDIAEVKNEIAPALMLSYHHLPSHLKRCFAYCSVLPKDYVFEEKQLVLLWMAEGLLQPQEGRKQMEDLGSEYFHNLLSRSFFQQSFKDGSRFLMHDLINDLAQWVAGDICFKLEDRVGGNNGRKPSRKTRHLSYLGGQYDGIQKFEIFYDLTYLRTFLPLMLPNPGQCYLTRMVPLKLLPKLRRLRVLSLSGYCISELPESIGNLKHLRYLDLSYTPIRELPESITTLYNLQTLILERCLFLKKLPSKFGNLINLRHLNILGANALEGMPMQIGKLTCLQSLSNLVVGKGSCFGVKELGPLLHLRETLCISGVENVINREDAMDVRLIEKHNLYGLSLEWSDNLDESQDRTSELEVLDMLQPHKGLKEFTVRHYGGAEFPTWLRVPSFSNMVLLKIESCAKCTLLPPVGQLPSLRDLFIEGMTNVKNVGLEFYGEGCLQPFRSLETLCFDSMREWENWIPCREFPKLRELSIRWCPKLLGKLPNHLPSLKNIVIYECRQLVVSISSFPELCKLVIEGSEGVVHGLDLPSKLRNIVIQKCEVLECLPKAMMYNNTYVEDIHISECTSLLYFAIGQLPPTLKRLYINKCTNMVILVDGDDINSCGNNTSLLEYLEISDCPFLKSLTSSGELPATLQHLKIWNCKKLELIARSFHHNSALEVIEISSCENFKSLPMGICNLSHLDRIYISKCPILDSFPDRGLLPTSLKELTISKCEKMQALPNCIHNLTSLQKLKIWECPSIVSFPEVGFLTNLTSLSIHNLVSFNEDFFERGLYKLTFLKELAIYGGSSHLMSFPEMMLPSSLISLSIECFPNLEYLSSKGFQFLNSLEKLFIRNCEKLTSFPEYCLPDSLLQLYIIGCPLLGERYKKDQGQDWFKIAHIPFVEIH